MSLRLIEIVVSKDNREKIRTFFEDAPLIDKYETPLMGDRLKFSLILNSSETEEVMDELTDHFESDPNFRLILQDVLTTLPRQEEEEQPPEPDETTEEVTEEKEKVTKKDRISREVLYDEIHEATGLTKIYIAMVILSAVVAAVGLLKDNLAVIIGAMVIAPLLGPNVALALSTTLGDRKLARRATYTNLVGILLALVVSIILGLFFKPDTSGYEIAARTSVSLADIALALVAGVAGSLAFTTGVSSALVGVMVAVALLPPLVTCGLLIGSGDWNPAQGAFLLLLTNLICINLAGVLTFMAQGIRPRTWYDAERAKQHSLRAVIIWIILLVALAIVIHLAGRHWESV
jgi:uncharacterized hydrophobic protein (TIGR00341 family)